LQINVTNSELSYLYSNAVAFVFPSLYEGFGMPILEAFSCGCPAILSEKSSLPEIAGEAALYFNPQNIESLREALEEILINQKLADSLTSLGSQRIKLFSWEQTVQQTIKTYNKVLNNIKL